MRSVQLPSRRAGLNFLFYLSVLVSSRSPGGADVNIVPIEFFIVACTFVLFHIFRIVTNYIDISRKMNYNGSRQFRRLEL